MDVHAMREDDASEIPPENGKGAEPKYDGVVLPEHASAYYSPRPPPATTAHDTIETEPVRLDPAIDPGLIPTQRLTVPEAEPPEIPLRSDAPTVLVPVVRARQRRRRAAAMVLAGVVGVTAGIGYALLNSPPSAAPDRRVPALPVDVPGAVVVISSAVGSGPEPPVDSQASTVPSDSPATLPPSVPSSQTVARKEGAPTVGAHHQSRRPAAWFKAESPKAWIK